MTSIVCIGNAGLDLIARRVPDWPKRAGAWRVVDDDLDHKVGGCGYDTAVGVARLDVRCKLVTGLGAGAHGRLVRAGLEEAGVECPEACTADDQRTSVELVVSADRDNPSALHFVGASRHLDDGLLRRLHGDGFFEDCVAIHISGLGLVPGLERPRFADALVEIVGHSPCLELSLDVSLRETRTRSQWLDALRPLLATGCVHVFSPNYEEACQIHGIPRSATIEESWARDFSEFLRDNFHGLAPDFCVIVRDGLRGSVAVDAARREVRQRAFKVEQVVDLSSAGEAWWAGFLAHRYAQHHDHAADRSTEALLPAMRFAHTVAARAVQSAGPHAWDFRDLR